MLLKSLSVTTVGGTDVHYEDVGKMTRLSVSNSKQKINSAAGLARELGVSAAAVSYALNGRPGVSDTTRNLILEAARRYGLPIPLHENRKRDQPTLGLVLADVGNPFYAELAVSIVDAADAHEVSIIMSQTNDTPEAIDKAVTTLINHGVEGLVLTAIHHDHAELLRVIRSARIPFVQLGRRIRYCDAPFVGIDDFQAGYAIVQHVLWHGYTQICIATGTQSSTASRARKEGMQAALSANGITLPGMWNVTTSFNEEGGRRLVRHLLTTHQTLPEVIVCGTDSMAMGAIAELHSHGFSVPLDVAVTGFDGLTLSALRFIGLTTVIQPRRLMAETALEALLPTYFGRKQNTKSVICPFELRIGTSCGCA